MCINFSLIQISHSAKDKACRNGCSSFRPQDPASHAKTAVAPFFQKLSFAISPAALTADCRKGLKASILFGAGPIHKRNKAFRSANIVQSCLQKFSASRRSLCFQKIKALCKRIVHKKLGYMSTCSLFAALQKHTVARIRCGKIRLKVGLFAKLGCRKVNLANAKPRHVPQKPFKLNGTRKANNHL